MSDPKAQAEPAMDEILATIRRIIAEDESGAASTAAGAPIVSSDVLELMDAIEPDGSVRHMAPFGSSLRSSGDTRVPPLPDGRIEPAPPSSSAASEPADRREGWGRSAGSLEDAAEREPLVSGVAAPRVAPLTPTPRDTSIADERPHVGGDRALENLVREMLLPMLQRWLDEKLPGLVDQAVRAEAARAAGDAVSPRRVTRTRPKAKPD
jgi:cell pole-organizing protein PopZ